MRTWIALIIAVVACRGSSDQAQPRSVPVAKVDPWKVGQQPDDPPSLAARHELAERACPTVKAPYFYEIEKAGKVSYILGTRHIGVTFAKFPAVVHDRLRAAKLVVFEVAPDDKSHDVRADIELEAAVGPELWTKFRSLVGADVANAERHSNPTMALITIMATYEDASAMLESEIEAELRDTPVPMRGLETAAFQDKVLDELLDLRLLRATLEQTRGRGELAQDSTDDLTGYCAGTDETPGTDPKQRAEMLASGYTDAEIDKIDERMVFARNLDWIPKLEQLFADGDVFVVVGAAHLMSKRGVTALLAAHGYTVTRITH